MVVLLGSVILPVYAGSPIGLERTEVGELSVDYGFMLDFDGTNDKVNITDNDLLDGFTNFSFCFWLLPHDLVTNYQNVIMKNPNTGGDRAYELYILSAKLSFFLNGATGFSTSVSLDGNLICVIIVREGNTLRWFLNDTARGSKVDANVMNTNAHDLMFGFHTTLAKFDGVLDEVQIWNRTLNATERTYYFNNGLGNYAPLNNSGLVGLWHCDEGSGIDVSDSSENNLDGVIVDGEGDEWITGFIETPDTLYPSIITITNVPEGYNCTLYHYIDGYVTSGIADSDEIASLTLPIGYRSASFEGGYHFYDGNGDSVLTYQIFLDVRGGDEYELIGDPKNLIMAFMLIGLFIAVSLVVLVKHNRG